MKKEEELQRIEFKIRVIVDSDSSDRAKEVSDRLLDGVRDLDGVVDVAELKWQRTRKLKG